MLSLIVSSDNNQPARVDGSIRCGLVVLERERVCLSFKKLCFEFRSFSLLQLSSNGLKVVRKVFFYY